MSRASFWAATGAIAANLRSVSQFYLKAAFIVLKICVSGGPRAATLVIRSQIGCRPCLCVLPFAATCPFLYRSGNERDGRPRLKKDAHDEGSPPHRLVGMDA